MFELLDTIDQQAVIKVVGVGGGGGNAVNYMQQSTIEGVEFIRLWHHFAVRWKPDQGAWCRC